MVAGIAIAVLSVRYNNKLLLIFGGALIPIGTLGCLLAPSFFAFQVFYPLDGIGSIIVGAMVWAIAGETLPLSKRGKGIGVILAGLPLASFFGSLLIRYFFSTGDWKSFLLFFSLPVSLCAVVIAYFALPSLPSKVRSENAKRDYLNSFRAVFRNKSATSCLLGNMMRHIGWTWSIVFQATFFRIWFGLPLALVALLALVSTISMVLGNVTGGHSTEFFGRKRQIIFSFILVALSVIMVAFVPEVWVAMAFAVIANFFSGMGAAGTINLTVEQTHNYRGTIMSMSTVFVHFGQAIGAAIGGALLFFFASYQVLAVVFVGFNLVAAGIYLFFAKDPCRNREALK